VLIDVPVEPTALTALHECGCFDVHCMELPAETARAIDPEQLYDVEVLFCTIPPVNFADLRTLRWVQIASAGYSQLFGLNLAARGIRATNARGCFDVPIGEWCVAMMVNLVRDLRQMIRNQEHGTWDRSAMFQRELRGMTVGLWGYGGLGRETARLAKQMGLRIHVLTRSGRVAPRRDVFTVEGTGDPDGVLPDQVFGAGQKFAFLASLDFLVLAVPLTRSTEGMVGEDELRALPRSAYLLNPARGPIVQLGPLLRALQEKRIAGAALDTHYQYPTPPDHPLWQMPNVIFTPHVAGSTLSPRFRERLWDIFVTNALRFARGEPLLNELSTDDLAGY
jgi:phosphoglycerate dehydrogenase-like enzyme